MILFNCCPRGVKSVLKTFLDFFRFTLYNTESLWNSFHLFSRCPTTKSEHFWWSSQTPCTERWSPTSSKDSNRRVSSWSPWNLWRFVSSVAFRPKNTLTLYKLYTEMYFVSFKASEELLKKHYDELKEKKFFPGLIKYMSSGPVVAMVGLEEVSTIWDLFAV